MTIKAALGKLRDRDINFTTLRAALLHRNLPTSIGWDRLELKFSEQVLPAAQRAAQLSALEDIYQKNVEWGDKAVQFLNFKPSERHLLDALVAHSFRAQLGGLPSFPSQLSATHMERLTQDPQLVRAISNSSRTTLTLYFYSKSYHTSKETFYVDTMKDAVSLKRFAGFDHVIAYRRDMFQRIDSVFIDPKNLRIELRLDITRLKQATDISEGLARMADSLRVLLRQQVDQSWQHIPFRLTNFFPKIEPLYNSKDGFVVQLGHNTAAGAINHGKMRGMSGDLKLDPSHVASITASATEKFAIKIAYPFYKGVSLVTVAIPGKSSETGSATPTVSTALVENCIDGTQFESMMQKLR